jgi:heme-degrading monooxygenase HmoA
MVEMIWEFVVKQEARGQFELTYGPGGAWSRLFATCSGFRGITLLRDTNNPCHYLTVDIWDTAAQREQALAKHEAEYSELETSLEDWVESRNEIGVFSLLAEATVRPLSRSEPRRRGHRSW